MPRWGTSQSRLPPPGSSHLEYPQIWEPFELESQNSENLFRSFLLISTAFSSESKHQSYHLDPVARWGRDEEKADMVKEQEKATKKRRNSKQTDGREHVLCIWTVVSRMQSTW